MKYRISFGTHASKREGVSLIRVRLSWPGGDYRTHTGWSVATDKWDKEKQLPVVKRGSKENEKLAMDISSARVKLENAFARYSLDGHIPSRLEVAELVADTFSLPNANKAKIDTVPLVMGRFISKSSRQNDWSNATCKKFVTLQNHLTAWNASIEFSDLTQDALMSFIDYMSNAGHRNTYIAKSISDFRWFLRWAQKEGYLTNDAWLVNRPRLKGTDGSSKEIIYLTTDELMDLYECDLSSHPSLECVRDVFCFCCFSGLRYSDVARLRKTDIRDGCIEVVTQKTTDRLKIELNQYSAEILKKYEDKPVDPRSHRRQTPSLALPVISCQKMNEELKEVARIAGIDTPIRLVYYKGSERVEEERHKYELITTHCARRTFVVTALQLGIQATTIMKWTGHSTYASMRPYVEITDNLKKQSMAKFNDIKGSRDQNATKKSEE